MANAAGLASRCLLHDEPQRVRDRAVPHGAHQGLVVQTTARLMVWSPRQGSGAAQSHGSVAEAHRRRQIRMSANQPPE